MHEPAVQLRARARLRVVIGETTALGLSVLMAIANLFAGIGLPAHGGLRPIESSLRSDVITMPDRHDHHRRNAHSGLRVKVTSPPPGPPEGPNSYSPA